MSFYLNDDLKYLSFFPIEAQLNVLNISYIYICVQDGPPGTVSIHISEKGSSENLTI